MLARKIWILILLVSFAFPVSGHAAGKIRDVVSETKKRDKKKASNKKKKRKKRGNSYKSSSNSSSDSSDLIAAMIALPILLPYHLTDTSFRRSFGYHTFPYVGGRKGAIGFGVDGSSPGKKVSLRLSGETKYVSEDLYGGGFGLRFQMNNMFELDTHWLFLRENVGEESLVLGTFGEAHLSVRFAYNESWQFRIGLGSRHLISEGESSLGFDSVYGIDVFLGRPFVLGLEGHLGNLGAAFSWQLRAQLGVLLGPVEFFGGYDALGIGSATINGPVAGLRLWL